MVATIHLDRHPFVRHAGTDDSDTLAACGAMRMSSGFVFRPGHSFSRIRKY